MEKHSADVLTDNDASSSLPKNTEAEDGMKGLKSVKDLGASDAGNFTAKAGTLLHKPDKASSLELFWKSRVSEITHAFVALTDKERGMLGRLIKLCPPGKAIAVVEIVLADWPFYAKRVQSAAGLPYVPMSPRVDFLLKYRSEAIILLTAAENAKKQEAVAPPVSVVEPVKLVASDEEEDDAPMDADDIGFDDLFPSKGGKW